MSQKVIRCPDDKLALLLEHGGLNCTSEAKAVAHGIMLDLRDCRAALAAAEAREQEAFAAGVQQGLFTRDEAAAKVLADEKASRIGWAESAERWRNHYYETLALLADERRDHDTAIKVLTELRYNDSASACWCPSDQNCDSPLWCRRAREVIAAHASRRAAEEAEAAGVTPMSPDGGGRMDQ